MIDLSRWPALVLAAGLATRLQPLSSVRAKAALPVAGDALIIRILRVLRRAGISRVVINLHHRAETITRLVGDGSRLDLRVRYSWETDVLGSAGGPARAIPLLESDRFLIVNGDTLADVDLPALATRHVDTNAMVTMAVVDADPRYNALVVNDADIVCGVSRREPRNPEPATGTRNRTPGTPGTFGTPGTPVHFIGIQAVNAATFAGVSPDVKSETVHGLYPTLIASRPEAIRVFRTASRFFDIGSPRDYLQTALAFAAGESRPHDRGVDCSIAADAQIADTVIWDRVAIGAGARLSRCIVADGVEVPAGAHFSDCSLVMRGREMIVTPL
jgi:NDP-sugar pyrophosphorylase family protein